MYDLDKFLIAYGFNAKPEGSHVIVILSGGEKVYLTPNGGASGLADLWKNPPKEINEPIRLNYANSIKKNATYHRSYNLDFIKSVSRTIGFPITPRGMCKEGSEQLGRIFGGLGYNVTYMYTPNNPGHEWTLIEDDSLNTWLAVDSYYGVMNDSDFYTASYSFPNPDYLEFVNPRWKG